MSVVYEGAGTGGNLFQGKTFWIAVRVPQRSRWEAAVKENGGSVVPLEKNADILIADHARANAPPGSYSWTFIEASIKNGRLEDLENHPAGQPRGTVRPIGSNAPTKLSRTPFTEEDDRMLAEWVTSCERRGLMTKGNKIYMELEIVNPRHTHQSWRDRWVKYLSRRPRPESSADAANEASHPGVVPRREIESNHRTARVTRPSFGRTNDTPISNPSVQTSSPPDVTIEPQSGKPFTEDDTQLLEDIYDDIVDIDESKIIAAWNAWAKEHPQHTAEEWHGHWVNIVKPRRRPDSAKASSPASRHERVNDSDIPKSEPEALLSAKGVISSSARDGPPNTANNDGYPSKKEDSQTVFTDETVFTTTLKIFADAQSTNIDLRPTVCGREIPLFAIWSCVNKEENGGFDEVEIGSKWKQIAVKLNFNTFRFPAAPIEIRDIYQQQLADFEEFCKTLETSAETEEELSDSQLIEMQLRHPAYQDSSKEVSHEVERAEDYDDDLESSTLLQDSHNADRKRPYPTSETPLAQHSQSKSNKRPKANDEEVWEIPSTPEPEASEVLQNGKKSRPLAPAFVADPETQDFHFSQDGSLIPGSSLVPSREESSGPQSTFPVPAEPREQLQEDSSTQSQTDSLREEAELQAFIDRYIGLGYSEQVVIEALQATTMDTGDVAEVMEALMRGEGIPSNIEGVWTSEDDRLLLSSKRDAYRSVEFKHGRERCRRRRQFLKDAEEVLKELEVRQ